MNSRLAPILIAMATLATASAFQHAAAQSTEEAANQQETVLDEILVTGEQSGPGLWRITKDEKTLWILGTYSPLPKKMTWRSRQVESVVAESQRVIRWPRIDADVDVGFFAGLAALPSLINVADNPDGAKLKDVVPADAYARWEPLKAKYIGRDRSIEEMRPSFAALQLRSEALKKSELVYSQQVWNTVERIAKKHKVKVVQPEVRIEVKVEQPRAIIKKFRKSQLADVQCFGESIARLESDLDALRARANAWSVGNLEVLKKVPPADPSTDCSQMLQQAILNGELADELGITEMRDRALKQLEKTFDDQRALWIGTIELEMQKHPSVFSVVPIDVLIGSQSPLQSFRERGYQIEEP